MKNKNKRKINLVWYTPLFSSSVKRNIGKKIINLVKNI